MVRRSSAAENHLRIADAICELKANLALALATQCGNHDPTGTLLRGTLKHAIDIILKAVQEVFAAGKEGIDHWRYNPVHISARALWIFQAVNERKEETK
jgi:hypothetical protein